MVSDPPSNEPPADQALDEPLRQPGKLRALAIGAPLTAALIGGALVFESQTFAEEKGATAEGTTFVFGANIDDREAIPEGAAADIQSMRLGMEYLTFEGGVDYDAFVDDYNNRLTGNDGDY